MRFCFAPLLLGLLVILGGCRDAKVASYRVPKETPEPLPPILTGAVPSTPSVDPKPATTPPGGDMASTAVPTASGAGLSWTAPADWRKKPTSAMRKGSYAITGQDSAEADLSITAFPGDVGGNLANVNRWRGQLELPALTESELAPVMTHMDVNELHADVVEFANPSATKPQRMIGAIIPFEGATWFIKLMGPDALVAQQKPAFLTFLKSIKASSESTR
ncbi:MAG: hypothetical protein ABIV50_12520 [Opitutus sp.]